MRCRGTLFLVSLSIQEWIQEVLIISWPDLNSPRLAMALMGNAVNDLMSLLVRICDSGTTECFSAGFGGQKELKQHRTQTWLLLVTLHTVINVGHMLFCLCFFGTWLIFTSVKKTQKCGQHPSGAYHMRHTAVCAVVFYSSFFRSDVNFFESWFKQKPIPHPRRIWKVLKRCCIDKVFAIWNSILK